MTAEGAKLNTRDTLGAFSSFAAPVTPRVLTRIAFLSCSGSGSREIDRDYMTYVRFFVGQAGGYTPYLPTPEETDREHAETLTRVNARTGGIFGTGADLFILTRQQLRKGFRVWRSAFPRRAADGWRVHTFPLFNRFERLPGVFRTSAAPELLKVGKSHAEPGNSPVAYFAGTSRGYRNRVRSTSPRWRGTQKHTRSKAGLRPNPPRSSGLGGQPRLSIVVVKAASSVKRQTPADVLGGMTPEGYALAHMEVVRAAQGKPRALAHVFAVFLRRVRRLAAVSLRALRELLAQLRRLRAERDTYAGYVQHINAAAYALLLADLSERLPASEQLPRPPDLLPLPPSAPLAPPA